MNHCHYPPKQHDPSAPYAWMMIFFAALMVAAFTGWHVAELDNQILRTATHSQQCTGSK